MSASHLPVVRRYIENQQQDHSKRSYEEEFLAILQKTGVGFEPQQVFG